MDLSTIIWVKSGAEVIIRPVSPLLQGSDVTARPHSLCCRPGVDHNPGAGHKAGIIRGEKDDALGDVIGRAEPADRVDRQGELTHRLDIVAAEVARLSSYASRSPALAPTCKVECPAPNLARRELRRSEQILAFRG